MSIQSLASVTALLLSIGAFCVTALLLRRYRLTSAARLSARLTEAEELIATLAAAVKSLRAAQNMRAYRERSARQADGEKISTASQDEERERDLRDLRQRVKPGGFRA